MSIRALAERIEAHFALPPEALGNEARDAFDELIVSLERGEARAAEPGPEGWIVNGWVKKGILLGFRLGKVVETERAGPLAFLDKDTLPVRRFSLADGVRVLPGGTSVRCGTFLGRGVIIVPPAYVNVGAHVGEGSLIDSHALVGSCAQVGRQVHVSAGAMIGGVLEPVGAMPVIVEDEVLVGGNCGIYEGTIVGRRAVLGFGGDPDRRGDGLRHPEKDDLPPRPRCAPQDSRGRCRGSRIAADRRSVRRAPRSFSRDAGHREIPRRENRGFRGPGGRPPLRTPGARRADISRPAPRKPWRE